MALRDFKGTSVVNPMLVLPDWYHFTQTIDGYYRNRIRSINVTIRIVDMKKDEALKKARESFAKGVCLDDVIRQAFDDGAASAPARLPPGITNYQAHYDGSQYIELHNGTSIKIPSPHRDRY